MSKEISEDLLKTLKLMESIEPSDKENDLQSVEEDIPDFDAFLTQALVDPEAGAKSLHDLVSKYKPLLYCICAEIHSMIKDLTNNDEWYATNARNYKQCYDAYMNVGFPEDQAFALVMKDATTYNNISKSISSSAKKSRSSK